MRKQYWHDEVYLYLSSPLFISPRHHHPAQLLPFPPFRNIIPLIGPSMPRSVPPRRSIYITQPRHHALHLSIHSSYFHPSDENISLHQPISPSSFPMRLTKQECLFPGRVVPRSKHLLAGGAFLLPRLVLSKCWLEWRRRERKRLVIGGLIWWQS